MVVLQGMTVLCVGGCGQGRCAGKACGGDICRLR